MKITAGLAPLDVGETSENDERSGPCCHYPSRAGQGRENSMGIKTLPHCEVVVVKSW